MTRKHVGGATLVTVAAFAWLGLSGFTSPAHSQSAPKVDDSKRKPSGSVTLFDEEEYGGDISHIYHIDLGKFEEGTLNIFGNDPSGTTARAKAESAKWDIAPGYFVLIYQHIDGRGAQLALWGKDGQPDLHVHDADNKMQAFRIVKP